MNEAIILACGRVSFVIESLILAHRLVFSFFEGIVLAILSLALVFSACGHDVGEQIGLLGLCHKITHRLVSSDCGHYIGEEIRFLCSRP